MRFTYPTRKVVRFTHPTVEMMPDYRRWYVPGGTFFFTVVTYRRYPFFRSATARKLLGKAMRHAGGELPFETVAVVLLWDHLHCLWTLPAGDADYPTRWKKIKGEFTQKWLESGGIELALTPSRKARGERGIWQRRGWEHTIRDEDDWKEHLDYIHYNSVKHGYVAAPRDWPYSTFGKYVRLGEYEENWGSQEPDNLRGWCPPGGFIE